MLRNTSVSIILPYFERPDLLATSLRSLQHLYAASHVEVVIIDDASRFDMRPILPRDYRLPTKLVTIVKKDGINPCIPINAGVRAASGNLILLSSPEIVHTRPIFDTGGPTPGKTECWFYNVFALTSTELTQKLINTKNHTDFMKVYSSFEDDLNKDLGLNGYAWSNSFGSWYSHPVHRRTELNFLSLMRRESFLSVGGFNESYRRGSGFDDNEFRRRMVSCGFSFEHLDSSTAIHLNHEEVSARADINVGINSNEKLYNSLVMRLVPRKSIRKSYGFEVIELNPP